MESLSNNKYLKPLGSDEIRKERLSTEENYSFLPNDVWKLIITLVCPSNYFNIHGICSSVRQCLLEIYKSNPILRENPYDVLSLLVFKQKFPVREYQIYETIIKGLNNHNRNELNKKHLIRALFQFNISYDSTYIASMLWNFLYKNNEYEILKHISKSNAIYIYNKILEIKLQREWTEKEEELFEYAFQCIISYYPKNIGELALQSINDRQINLFLKFYETSKLNNLFYCLMKLVKQNDSETVEYLLDRHEYNKKSYKKLWKVTNKDDEDMQDLILSYL